MITEQATEGRRGQPAVLVWASAGFGAAEAERWRSAGWDDASVAAEWRVAANGHADPVQLRALEQRGHEPADVRSVADRGARYAPAWLAATVVSEGDTDHRRVVALTMLDRLFPQDHDATLAWCDRMQQSRSSMVSSAQSVADEMAALQASAASR